MYIVKITRKYQVTIPKEVREKLGLRVGDLVAIEIQGDVIVLKPLFKRRRSIVNEMLSLVKKPLDIDAVKFVEESWNED